MTLSQIDADGNELVPGEGGIESPGASEDCAGLVPTFDNEDVDLSLYHHVTVEPKAIGMGTYVDALIPLAGKAADAASQWNHAVVRFPKGASWKDLVNRKTPGWEDWKQLVVRKDNKFQPHAAIKQAKIQPAAVANLALQGAAIAVGQAYMAEISKQLEGIESGIAAIQQEMRMEREADIEARFEKLLEYLAQYEEISANPEKKQAVLNAIEATSVESLKAWKFQIKSMKEFGTRLERSGRLKEDEVRDLLREFQSKERGALTAFQFFAAAEQASMQYDGDFATTRIAREREKICKCLDEYAEVRSWVQSVLNDKIKEANTGLLAVPDVVDDGYRPQNRFLDTAHFMAQNASRITPIALRKEAQRQEKDKKERYLWAAGIENPVALIGKKRDEDLVRMDFMYNGADAMLIDDEGIHFLRTHEMTTGNDGGERSPADA